MDVLIGLALAAAILLLTYMWMRFRPRGKPPESTPDIHTASEKVAMDAGTVAGRDD
jgi:hypothetical protein